MRFLTLRTFLLLKPMLFAASLALAAAPDASDTKKEDDSATPLSESPRQESLGKEITKFGEEVASRVDKVVRKNAFQLWGDPWTIQGIPLIFPSPNTGFNLGLRLLLNNMRRADPHKFEVEAQVLSSDRGRYKYFLKLDAPHALGDKLRVTTRVSYDRDMSFRYFGIGNSTPIDQAALDSDSILYQNVRAGPSFNLQVLRLLGKLRFGPVLGLRWTQISAPLGSLLERDQTTGIRGGRTHYLGFAIVHDTLDFEPYPTRGTFHELFFEMHNRLTASEYEYYRWTYTFRHYVPLHRELVFAHRTLFEALSGDVPYYELGAVGGSNPSIGFGGDKYFRGYQSNRYIDYLKLALGFELRWDPLTFGFARQDISLGIVPFLDIGRVWPRVLPLTLEDLHVSAGWGARIIWNRRLIVRSDFAVTKEGAAFFLELGHSF